MLFVLYKGTYIIVHILLLLLKIITNFQQNLTTTNNLLQCHLVYVVKLLRRIVGVKDTVLSLKETPNKLLWLYALLMARLLTDVCKILESVLILPTCGNLEILFLPVCHCMRWRSIFLITIALCICTKERKVDPLGPWDSRIHACWF